jgi:hypothetical protein
LFGHKGAYRFGSGLKNATTMGPENGVDFKKSSDEVPDYVEHHRAEFRL